MVGTGRDERQQPNDRIASTSLGADGASFHRAAESTPLTAFSAPLSLPPSVRDRGSCDEYLAGNVPELIMEVLASFQDGLSKVPGMTPEQREKLELTVRLAIDETLTNAIYYGLLGMTSDERVRAFLFCEDEPEFNRLIGEKITSAASAERRGSVELTVFPDRVDLTIYDGTKFPDFKERWRDSHQATEGQGLERASGRGLLLLKTYGFEANQAESGAVTYSLSYAAVKD